MSLSEQIILALVDKGLLALVVAAVGHYLNTLLQKHRARDEFLVAIAASRVEAYKELWKLTEQLKIADIEKVRQKLETDLEDWYYDNAGALFLSFNAADKFFRAKESLDNQNIGDVKKAFSSLRTELKYDCGIYSSQEKSKQLPSGESMSLDVR